RASGAARSARAGSPARRPRRAPRRADCRSRSAPCSTRGRSTQASQSTRMPGPPPPRRARPRAGPAVSPAVTIFRAWTSTPRRSRRRSRRSRGTSPARRSSRTPPTGTATTRFRATSSRSSPSSASWARASPRSTAARAPTSSRTSSCSRSSRAPTQVSASPSQCTRAPSRCRCSRSEPTSSGRGSCRRSRAASTWARSRSPSPRPAPTRARCARAPSPTATAGASPARSSGSRTAATPARSSSSRAPTRTPPARAASARSSSTSTTNDIVLDGARVGRDRLLHEENKGFRVAMQTLDGGRIGIAAQALGIAQAAFEVAREYAKERHTFGKPIAEHQAIQSKLADMATEIDAARLLVYRAAALKDKGEPVTEAGAKAKLFASEVARRQTGEAIQILGGYGYTTEFPVERYYRDAKVTEIYEGTSEIQRLVIARSILGLGQRELAQG